MGKEFGDNTLLFFGDDKSKCEICVCNVCDTGLVSLCKVVTRSNVNVWSIDYVDTVNSPTLVW
jgi:hypothetical protein